MATSVCAIGSRTGDNRPSPVKARMDGRIDHRREKFLRGVVTGAIAAASD
jgi:hypothetical protein